MAGIDLRDSRSSDIYLVALHVECTDLRDSCGNTAVLWNAGIFPLDSSGNFFALKMAGIDLRDSRSSDLHLSALHVDCIDLRDSCGNSAVLWNAGIFPLDNKRKPFALQMAGTGRWDSRSSDLHLSALHVECIDLRDSCGNSAVLWNA